MVFPLICQCSSRLHLLPMKIQHTVTEYDAFILLIASSVLSIMMSASHSVLLEGTSLKEEEKQSTAAAKNDV